MCQFVSWIEKDGAVLFLTGKQVYHTKRGKELREYTKHTDELVGHGAIRWFYNIDGGTDKECDDFSSPKRFPSVIVEAIKGGEMRGMGTPNGLLTRKAYAEYLKVCAAAYAEYEKVSEPALAEYEKVSEPAYTEYRKVCAAASAEYDKVRDAAWAEYDKVRDAAWAEYEKVIDAAFWDLFDDPKNRTEAWK